MEKEKQQLVKLENPYSYVLEASEDSMSIGRSMSPIL